MNKIGICYGKVFFWGLMFMVHGIYAFSDESCVLKIKGYNIVKNSIFPFFIDKKPACFFAYYTTNPDPHIDTKGNGNAGPSIWYAYYKTDNSTKIYKFPKPSSDDWSNICTINAVSFSDMNGDKIPDVTIIGSCERNPTNYNFPLVFLRKNNKFVYYKKVENLFGFIGLTVDDIRAYIKSPEKNYKYLRDRYN